MERLKGRLIFSLDVPFAEIGEIRYLDIPFSDPEMELSVLYRVRGKCQDGGYCVEALALAFDTREHYQRLLEAGAQEGTDGPDVYIADEDDACFLSETEIPTGLPIPLTIDIQNGDGGEEKIWSDCAIVSSQKQEDGSYKTVFEPFDPGFKRHLLIMSRLHPDFKLQPQSPDHETYF